VAEPNGQENITSVSSICYLLKPHAEKEPIRSDNRARRIRKSGPSGKRKGKSRNRDASSIMPVVKSYRRRISMPAVTKTNGKSIAQEREKAKRKANPKAPDAD
jgi:hypothetical protein